MKEKVKLIKSKQFLADAIHASGKGWPDGAKWAAQDKRTPLRGFDIIVLYKVKPKKPRAGSDFWGGDTVELDSAGYIRHDKLIPNWHQTCLSREEYFSAYPAEPVADADGWIEWKGGECPVDDSDCVDYKLLGGSVITVGEQAGILKWTHEFSSANIIAYRLHKPEVKPDFFESVTRSIPEPEAKLSIEQLAADYRDATDYAERKQQDADAAKNDAEAKLALLVEAGKAHGLAVSPITEKQGPELVITNINQLELGDVIWISDSTDKLNNVLAPAGEYKVVKVGMIGVDSDGQTIYPDFSIREWRFIRRP